MKAILDIKEIITVIDAIKKSSGYKTTNIELLSSSGKVIYETDKNTVFDAPPLLVIRDIYLKESSGET